MKDKINRPIVSKGSPVVPVLAALTALAFGIYGVPAMMEELKTGQTYSLAVIFGDGTKIFRSSSPVAFWMNVGFFILSFASAIILGIWVLFGTIIDCKRRAAKKKRLHESGL
jgi:hypothetical protein